MTQWVLFFLFKYNIQVIFSCVLSLTIVTISQTIKPKAFGMKTFKSKIFKAFLLNIFEEKHQSFGLETVPISKLSTFSKIAREFRIPEREILPRKSNAILLTQL